MSPIRRYLVIVALVISWPCWVAVAKGKDNISIVIRLADSYMQNAFTDKYETSAKSLCQGLTTLYNSGEANCADVRSVNSNDCKYITSSIRHCEALAEKRKQVRLEALSSSSIQSIEAIPEKYRLPEEERRIAQWEEVKNQRWLGEEEKLKEQLNTIESNKTVMVPILSDELCSSDYYLREYKSDLNMMIRYSHPNTIDPKISEFQSKINTIISEQKALRAKLKKLGANSLSCDSKQIRQLRSCIRANGFPPCQTMHYRLILNAYQWYHSRRE